MKTVSILLVILFSSLTFTGDEILVDATADQIVAKIAEFEGEKPVLVNF